MAICMNYSHHNLRGGVALGNWASKAAQSKDASFCLRVECRSHVGLCLCVFLGVSMSLKRSTRPKRRRPPRWPKEHFSTSHCHPSFVGSTQVDLVSRFTLAGLREHEVETHNYSAELLGVHLTRHATPRVAHRQMLGSDHRSLRLPRTSTTCCFRDLPRRLLFHP